MIKKIFFVLISISILFSSCADKSFFTEKKDIANTEWSKEDILKYNFVIEDTNKIYNIVIDIRNNTDYLYSNVFIFTKIIYPNNSVSLDTIEALIAQPTGEWLGKGMGSIKECRFLISQNRFAKAGNYSIELCQAMYDDPLYGIESVGISLIEVDKSR